MAREYNWNVKNKATKGYEVRWKDLSSRVHVFLVVLYVGECKPFSSPKAAILLVGTKDQDLWSAPTTEVHD